MEAGLVQQVHLQPAVAPMGEKGAIGQGSLNLLDLPRAV
jgi:hypothetical protein